MRRQARVIRHMLRLSTAADPWVVVIVVVLVVAQAGALAATAVSQRWVVDSAGLGRLSGILGAAALGAFAWAVGTAGSRIQVNLQSDLANRVDVMLTDEILRAAGSIPTLEHLERADYVNRIALLKQGVRPLSRSCWTVANFASTAVSVGLSLALLATVHPALVALAAAAVPALYFARRGHRIVTAAIDSSAESNRREQALHELCLRADTGKEVRVNQCGPEVSGQASEAWDEVRRTQTRAQLAMTAWQMCGWLCYSAGVVVALGFIVALATRGEATVGDVVMTVALASQLQGQVSSVTQAALDTGRAAHVIDHYLWLRDYADSAPGGRGPAPTRLNSGIVLRQVAFRYPGQTVDALTGIDLRLPAGSVIGLVGVNGAGKTTLVKVIAGLCRPTHGTIEVDGAPLAEVAPPAWAAVATAAFQDFVKFAGPARHAVGLGDLPHLDDDDAVAAAVERAHAATVISQLPDGFDTQLGREFGGSELSQGQWQKLAVARAMMRATPLLIVLDEPTAALDPQAESDLFDDYSTSSARAARASGAITVLVSHRFSTVSMADHLVVLDHGAVVEQGTHADLMRANGVYARSYRLQADGYRPS